MSHCISPQMSLSLTEMQRVVGQGPTGGRFQTWAVDRRARGHIDGAKGADDRKCGSDAILSPGKARS